MTDGNGNGRVSWGWLGPTAVTVLVAVLGWNALTIRAEIKDTQQEIAELNKWREAHQTWGNEKLRDIMDSLRVFRYDIHDGLNEIEAKVDSVLFDVRRAR